MEEENVGPDTKRVFGTVRKMNGDGLSHVSIKLVKSGELAYTTQTDDAGLYEMKEVEYGPYVLTGEKEGYKKKEIEVEVK